jgi:peptidoglycan/LPS O-acetylase OafA/YrhL
VGARADRFPLFDSMRALAALGVLATHASFAAGLSNDPTSTLRPYTARLDVGVAVFFLISGFLLYRPFVKARVEGEPRPQTLPYAWRRFLRIVPAYWVALTVTVLWLGGREILHPDLAPVYYGFAQIYDSRHILGGMKVAWTLCVEVSFYVALPVWAWAMSRIPGRTREVRMRQDAIAVAALFAAGLVYKLVAFSIGGDPRGPEIFVLPNFVDHFALGMGLAVASVWWADRPSPRLVKVVERWPAMPWLLAAIAFWAVSTRIGLTGLIGERGDAPRFIVRHYLYGAVAFFLLLPAVFGAPRQGLLRRWLANPVLAWLGLISYGIFLWNASVFEQFVRWRVISPGDAFSFEKLCLLGLAPTVVIAAASYYVIERPALSLKRLIPDRSRVTAGEAVRDTAPAAPVVRR